MRELAHVHLCLFEFVNLGENLRQRLVVGGAEIFAARLVSDLLQRLFVNHHFLLFVVQTSELVDVARSLGHAVCAYAYRVNLDLVFLGYLGGVCRGQQSSVVCAVGDEDDDARIAAAARKGHLGQRQRLADRRSLHGGHRGRNPFGEGFGHAVVGGDRQLYGGVACEDDHPDAILFQSVE